MTETTDEVAAPKVGDTRLIITQTYTGKWSWRVERYDSFWLEIEEEEGHYWALAYNPYDVFHSLTGTHRKRHKALEKGVRDLNIIRGYQMIRSSSGRIMTQHQEILQ